MDSSACNLICKAVAYCDMASNRPVMNVLQFKDILHIELPEKAALERHNLLSITYLSEDSYSLVAKSTSVTSRWVDIPCNLLDSSAGVHSYCITLADPISSDTYRLYFTYLIQDDNPNTPYIYMNRQEECSNNG